MPINARSASLRKTSSASNFYANPEQDGESKIKITSPALFENLSDLMEIEEVAAYLGVAQQTIRNWIACRKLPHVRIGGRNRVLRSSLEAWVREKEVQAWQ